MWSIAPSLVWPARPDLDVGIGMVWQADGGHLVTRGLATLTFEVELGARRQAEAPHAMAHALRPASAGNP
ncbi:MAG: hypothetical protein WKG00_04080 [Polyangiaceae bacterium]